MRERDERPARRHRNSDDHDVAAPRAQKIPGKLAATDNLGGHTSLPPSRAAFDRAIADARRCIAELNGAISAVDAPAALRAAELLRAAVARARQSRIPERTHDLDALAVDAEVLLARAPRPSSAAMREGAAGSWATWDREMGAWRSEIGATRDTDPATAARAGIVGSGGPLPHAARIQASFGRHDISAIRVYTDEHAARATRELGARAYAYGNAIAFASHPELFTAAHEAAHVIQQRAGVAVSGSDDAYEQHADEVAHAVVAGESAETVLDKMAGTGANSAPVVQREAANKSVSTRPAGSTSPAYCNTHRVTILGAIADRVRAVELARPHPRLYWSSREAASQAVIDAFVKDLDLFHDRTLHRLMELAAPADLLAIVDEARRGTERSQWRDEVGVAIATALDAPLDASIRRMGMRLRVQLDGPAHGSVANVGGLVASCPLDGVVEDVLLKGRVVGVVPGKPADANDTEGKPFLHGLRGLREIAYEWVKGDPTLWNWIRVTSPADPTVEEVANLPLAGARSTGTTQAYRIVASPPFFGIPIETARLVDEACGNAGVAQLAAANTSELARETDSTPLHDSAFSDEAALAQAGRLDPLAPSLPALLDRVEIQLDILHDRLAPWKHAADQLGGPTAFMARRRAEAKHDPKLAHRWTAAVAGQERIMYAAGSDVVAIFDELEQKGVKRRDYPVLPRPVVDLLQAYAHAAGVSHLAAEARPALADARRARALLPLALTEGRIHSARDAIADQRTAGTTEPGADATDAAVPGMITRAADLRMQAMRGEKLDGTEVDQLATDADEMEVRARLATLAGTVRFLKARAAEADAGIGRDPGGTWSVDAVCDLVLDQIYGREKPHSQGEGSAALRGGWLRRVDEARRLETSPGRKNPTQYMKTTVAAINREIKTLGDSFGGLRSFVTYANERIADAEMRKHWRALAIEIAVMVATGQIVGSGFAALRGIVFAAELAEDVRGASLLWKGAELFAHAGLQTVASGALGGEVSARAFAENGLGMLLTSAAMKPFHALLNSSELQAIEKQIETFAQLAKRSAKVGTELVIGAGVGTLASSAAHAIVNDGELGIASYDEVINQALSLSVSEFVGSRARVLHGQLTEVAADHQNERLKKLAERADALARRATETKHAAPEQIAALLEERVAIARAAKPELDALGPAAKRKAPGVANDLAATDASFLAVPLHLSGLSSVVGDVAFQGTSAQVHVALDHAAKMGLDVTATRDGHRWTLECGGRTITVNETERAATSTGHPAHADRGSPAQTRYGEVWPGEVPQHASPQDRQTFEAAARIYEHFKKAAFQGASFGRIEWAKHLVDHGIAVEGVTRSTHRSEIYEERSVPAPVPPHDRALLRTPELSTRSPNVAVAKVDVCLKVVDEIIAHGSLLKGAHRAGDRLTVPLPDGGSWHIEISAPRSAGDEMAALKHEAHGDLVWVADTLPADHIPRALGAIIADSVAAAGHGDGHSAQLGELDAMFAHREVVAHKPRATLGHDDPTPAQTKAYAHEAVREESTARIEAEIDLALFRVGITELNADAERRLAAMAPGLATRIRAHLGTTGRIGFRSGAMVHDSAVPHPAAIASPLPPSTVLPEAPKQVRAYTEADRLRLLELRVELEALKELDARTALRDLPGTNNSPQLAIGETMRRTKHLSRARELLAELQLGGNDAAYVEARLHELAAVFPGVEHDIAPAVRERVRRRKSAERVHVEAEAFRTAQRETARTVVADIVGDTKAGKAFVTKRAIVGAGLSAVADVATLNVSHAGTIDPHQLVVIGTEDVVAKLHADQRWGQRRGVYDRPRAAHPAFSDHDGRGNGELDAAVEDPGDFMKVQELRDATDLARKRLGIVALPGEVKRVETTKDNLASEAPWHRDAGHANARVLVTFGKDDVYLYATDADLSPGPGKPRMPDDQIMPPDQRQALFESKALRSGDELLGGLDVRGKRVFVLAFGPTGAWVARYASDQRAARVDWGGAAGGEHGTGGAGQLRDGTRWRDNPSNDRSMQATANLDRVQDALDPGAGVHITFDRVLDIKRKGAGGVVTYAHGPGENVELYDVEYDVIVTSMGFDTADDTTTIPGAQRTVKEMIGNMKMIPQRGTKAPVLADASTGHVRVLGYASGDLVNVSIGKGPDDPNSDYFQYKQREAQVTGRTSADTPDARAVEGVGMATTRANRPGSQQ